MKKKMLWALVSLLVLFGIISLVAFVNLQRGKGILDVMPAHYENLIVIAFCVLSSFKVVWEMHKI